jgi:hypothetical protein
MEGAGAAVLIFVVMAAGIGIWIFSSSLDRDRITDYVRERGGRIVSINWAPFGKGWFGEKQARIYEVVYYDDNGNQHFATCKTSMWSGVYWTEDRITHGKSKWYDSLPPTNEPNKPLIGLITHDDEEDPSNELRRLREENARLREQLAGASRSDGTDLIGKCPACGASITSESSHCPDCQIALR